jgi:hypothetical protein
MNDLALGHDTETFKPAAYSSSAAVSGYPSDSYGMQLGEGPATGADTSQVRPPRFEIDTRNTVLTTFAGRLNAGKTSPAEIESWFREHAALTMKEMEETLDPADIARLDYVRWNLNRIEDARVGPHIDKLEVAIDHYEGFLTEIRQFLGELDRVAGRKHR